MPKSKHYIDKLFKHIKKQGTKGLLPQNLPDELLRRMNLEAEAIRNDKTEETPSSTLLLSILHLADPTARFDNNIEIKIEPDILMEYFDLYMVALKLEEMRRNQEVEIDESSLPTLQNIFDKNRTFNINVLE